MYVTTLMDSAMLENDKAHGNHQSLFSFLPRNTQRYPLIQGSFHGLRWALQLVASNRGSSQHATQI